MHTKKILAALSTILALVLVNPAKASAEPRNGSARMQMQFCKLASDEIAISVGECLRTLRSIRGIAKTCKSLHEKDQLWLIEAMFDEEAANRGQCMRILRKKL